MKTKEQILGWLDKQPWKNEFYENSFKHNIGDRISFNENFIRSSFDWPIGGGVWIEREEEYLKWYNSNDRPMSWEEYCEQNPITEDEYVIDNNHGVFPLRMKSTRSAVSDITVMSKELCEAFIAYMKLIQLRNAWVRDCDYMNMYHKVVVCNDAPYVKSVHHSVNGLSFPYAMLANEFINTFKDLLETAKPLL
mgnify:FL=1